MTAPRRPTPDRKPAPRGTAAPWSPPTRRAFFAALGAAAAALAVRDRGRGLIARDDDGGDDDDDRRRRIWAGTTRWIGHC